MAPPPGRHVRVIDWAVERFSARLDVYMGGTSMGGDIAVAGFADTILHGTPQQGAGIEDGVAAMRAMVAIARSAETGEPVALADVYGAV